MGYASDWHGHRRHIGSCLALPEVPAWRPEGDLDASPQNAPTVHGTHAAADDEPAFLGPRPDSGGRQQLLVPGACAACKRRCSTADHDHSSDRWQTLRCTPDHGTCESGGPRRRRGVPAWAWPRTMIRDHSDDWTDDLRLRRRRCCLSPPGLMLRKIRFLMTANIQAGRPREISAGMGDGSPTRLPNTRTESPGWS